ncbi:MAG: Rieske 2Fe-2S domain-containing protein [Cyanobacteria bacterium J06649_5]
MNPVLPGAPWLIAHRSMLGVNQPYKVTLNGTDYVLWQSSKGEISALENVCPHMQAPLSSGWICRDRNTLACPFHALEFDGAGRLYQGASHSTKEQSTSNQPLAKPLAIIVQGDFIWTYGNHEPVTDIPTFDNILPAESTFVGVTGNESIHTNFLRAVMVNYDFNHATATHRYPLNLQESNVLAYKEEGHISHVKQEIVRGPNTWLEMLKDPSLAFTPKRYVNTFEYTFPSTNCLTADLPTGQITSFFILYPESETSTKTFVLVFAKTPLTWLVPLLRTSILKAFGLVVRQDVEMLEQLYERSHPKIRLPQENVMFRAEKLYRNWPSILTAHADEH